MFKALDRPYDCEHNTSTKSDLHREESKADDHQRWLLTTDGKEEDDQNPDQLRTDATATRS